MTASGPRPARIVAQHIGGAHGVTVDIGTDGRQGERAQQLETAGYGALWIAGGSLRSLDLVLDLLDAAQQAVIATGIIPLDVFGLDEVIRVYRLAEQHHPGRFLMGLGGPQQSQALAKLGAFLDSLDRAGVPADRHILAALGPVKLRLAAERALGAVPLLVTPDWVRTARAALGEAAALVVSLPVALTGTAAAGRAALRPMLDFLLQVNGYRQNLLRCGFTAQELDGRSDRVIDGIIAHGDAGAIARRVQEYLDAGADQVDLAPVGEAAHRDALALAPVLQA
ncbi:MAG: TIGR03620 family F420-dependent LLM class oxidoreductase [Nakamurella sp.]